MAITFRAAGTLVDNAGAASITVTKPAGLTLGDFVIVQLILQTTTSVVVSPPDNTWYLPPLGDTQNAGSHWRSVIFYHVATGSEPTWTFTLGQGNQAFAISCAYSGVGSIDICGLARGTASPALAPSITPALNGGTILCIITNNNSAGASTTTLDGALTSRYNSTDATTHYTVAMGDAAAPSGGVGSTAYSNTVVTGAWVVHSLILNPGGTLYTSEANVCLVPTGTDTSTTPGSGATTIVGTVPAGIQNGDILVAFFRALPGGAGDIPNFTITAPVGWTVVREDLISHGTGTFGQKMGMYTHAVTNVSGEPGTYTWTISSATNVNYMSLEMVPVRGCSAIDTNTFTKSTSDVSTLAATGITPTKTNEPVLVYGTWSSDTVGDIDIVGFQTEVGNQGHRVWSTISGLAGVAMPNITVTGGAPEIAAVYVVGFLPTITNAAKIINFTVVNRYSAVTSQAITIPSGTASGDYLVAHVMGPTAGSITPPAGWSAITNALADNGTVLAQAFAHTVAGGDPASVTFNFSGATTGCASIIAFRNTNANLTAAANSTTQGLTPSLSGIVHNSLVLMYETCTNNGTHNGIGLPQSSLLTPFVYNPTPLNGGNISRGGALSVVLQTGPDGGTTPTEYRAAPGSISGPQMTIAVVAAAPPPPPPPPPPPTGGKPTTQNLPFIGQIQRLTTIPPISINPKKPADAHEVNLALKSLSKQLATINNQLQRFAANPQQHYKLVSKGIPTVEENDVAQSFASSDNVAPVQSSDTDPTFASTGYTSTLGAAATVTNVTVNNATPTNVTTASPSGGFTFNNSNNQADLVMAVVSGTWAAGMFGQVMDITYAGTPSSSIYFAKRLNVDAAGRFSDTQIFPVPSGVTGDTGIIFGTSQSTGGAVVITTCTLYVGNIQQR